MKHEAEQFDLPLPGVPPVREKASLSELIAEARAFQEGPCESAKCYYIIGKLIKALEE